MPLGCSFKTTDADSGKFRTTGARGCKATCQIEKYFGQGFRNYSILVVSHCRCLQLGTSSSKILDNKPGFELYVVRLCFECLVAAISRWQPHSGVLEASIVHFLKVTHSYGQDSFIAMLSMDYLEPTMISSISSVRHHQRRCSGRKVASASLVLRGSVLIVAALATQLKTFQPAELVPASLQLGSSYALTWHSIVSSGLNNCGFAVLHQLARLL